MKLRGGFTTYGQDIGILMMDTVFPRILGDIGNARTYDFPVRYYTVKNIEAERMTEQNAEQLLLAPFIQAAKELEASGCKAITTSCSFLCGFQRQLADAVTIPVFTSTLLLAPFVHTTLNKNRTIGILTESASYVGEEYFQQAGWSSKEIPVCVTGLAENSPFSKLIIGDHLEEDFEVLEDCIREMALRHMAEHPDTGAILLECTNFAPFTSEIQRLTGVPVFGINQLLSYMDTCINAPSYHEKHLF